MGRLLSQESESEFEMADFGRELNTGRVARGSSSAHHLEDSMRLIQEIQDLLRCYSF
jgi:hypothetical protein